MVKDLFLIRHAEAVHSSNTSDFDRPLTEKGFSEGIKMAQYFKEYTSVPDLIITSPAKRALQTASLFAEEFNLGTQQIQPENMIYEADVSALLSIVNHIPDEIQTIALFGHNPGISLLAGYLTGEQLGSLSTAGIFHIQFQDINSWKLISKGLGEIKWAADPGT